MPGLKLAIDFGSNNFTAFTEGRGITLQEPSLMICDRYTGLPIAVGGAAQKMSGKLPASLVEVTPIKDGIVYDFPAACRMLRVYLNKLCAGRLLKPDVLMSVPGNVTPLERKTLVDAITRAGAGRACFVEEPLAAAIGAGVSLNEPKGSFICDIGGGTTACAVVTMGNIAVSGSVKIGGNDLTKTVMEYIRREHNVEIGQQTAESIKKNVGSAIFRTEEVAIIFGGKNCDTGLPVLFEITSTEIYWILKTYVEDILTCIKSVFEKTPPELVSDIAEKGIILTGGTANLFGLDRFVEWNTGVRTVKALSPENCAVYGLGRLLKEIGYLEKNGYVFLSSQDDEEEQ
ncbi:MAG: rod shape-determining protein [Clostridia bacterium]|nr:rod shape-determining protein [Clostridia bacterium]